MPIRNPFARRSDTTLPHDENADPSASGPSASAHPGAPGFERVDTVGSKSSSVLSIRTSKSQDNGEYKLSVVNDSGIYLPPSPTEDHGEKPPWSRKLRPSRTSTDTRSDTGEIDNFPLSRESFDSYRRSFDISAKAPVLNHEPSIRHSLDSSRFARPPRLAVGNRPPRRQPLTEEERFEDVGLDDNKPAPPQPRRRGFFSKFSDPAQEKALATARQSGLLAHGRKRGQSQSGSELGTMQKPEAVDREDQ